MTRPNNIRLISADIDTRLGLTSQTKKLGVMFWPCSASINLVADVSVIGCCLEALLHNLQSLAVLAVVCLLRERTSNSVDYDQSGHRKSSSSLIGSRLLIILGPLHIQPAVLL